MPPLTDRGWLTPSYPLMFLTTTHKLIIHFNESYGTPFSPLLLTLYPIHSTCLCIFWQEILFETHDIYPELQEVCLDQNLLQTESEHLKSWLVQTFLPWATRYSCIIFIYKLPLPYKYGGSYVRAGHCCKLLVLVFTVLRFLRSF